MTTPRAVHHPKAAKAGALHRDIGVLDATMLVMGAMIGSGIFITSAESARLVGAPGWLLLAWALAGLMTISGAIASAELAAMMPRAGGQYVFLRVAYGPMFGFLFGWSLFLVVQTGTIAAVAVAFAKFLGVFWPAISADAQPLFRPVILGHYAVSLSTQQLVAVALIVILTITNTRGLKLGTLIQNTFTFAKTAALAALIVIGLTLGWSGKAAAWTSSWWNSTANGWTSLSAYAGHLPVEGGPALIFLLGLAMIGPLFSQSAWNNVTFTGGETRDPGRTLPRALFLGTTSVVALYLLANVAYLVSLPFAEIQHAPQDRVGTAAMEAALGPARPLRDGGGDTGLDLRMRQRPGPGWRAGLLRDGSRWSLLQERGHDQFPPRAGSRAGGAGHVGGATGFAGDRHHRPGHASGQVRQPLQ